MKNGEGNFYKNFLNEMEQSIRSGDLAVAREKLQKSLEDTSLTSQRDKRLELAGFCRRLGLPLAGITLLRKEVRPSSRKGAHATEEEKIEYAGNLIRLGLTAEARNILTQIDKSKIPRGYLFEAFCDVSHWDFQASIAPLKLLISSPLAEDYDRDVSRLNLLIAYVETDEYEKSFGLARELEKDFQRKNHTFLYSTVLEAMATLHYKAADYASARRVAQIAKRKLHDQLGIDAFLLHKIEVLTEVALYPKKLNQCMLSLKREASRLGHYESLRDVDFYIARFTQNEKKLKFLYFGTPYTSYRQKILKSMSLTTAPWTSYQIQVPFRLSSRAKNCIDLTSGKWNGKLWLKKSHLLHRLQTILFSDFYRPLSTMSLYNQLYPESFFNPNSAPNQIHQATYQLNQAWSKLNAFQVKQEKQKFYLQNLGDVHSTGVIIREKTETYSREGSASLYQKIETLLASSKIPITRKNFQLKYNLSERTANRYLSLAVKNGRLHFNPQDNHYRFNKNGSSFAGEVTELRFLII